MLVEVTACITMYVTMSYVMIMTLLGLQDYVIIHCPNMYGSIQFTFSTDTLINLHTTPFSYPK